MKRIFRMGIGVGYVCLASACTMEVQENESETSPEPENIGVTKQALGPCTVGSIAIGSWYSQNNPSWASTLLGNSSSDTIGGYGCVISSLSMVYQSHWGVATTPSQLNTSAKAAGCFGAGSSLLNVGCAINSRGGSHTVTEIPMSDVANAICAYTPVMVDVTWGAGHKMLVYHYTGGSPTSMSSYKVVDPWDGTTKFLSSYTATRWRKLN